MIDSWDALVHLQAMVARGNDVWKLNDDDVEAIRFGATAIEYYRTTRSDVDNLSTLVNRLARVINKSDAGHAIAEQAIDYLQRRGLLLGSVLREDE